MSVTAVDTSVAVPLLVASHRQHVVVAQWSCPLGARAARAAHREFARRGIAGGATYDGLVAVAARERGAVLFTRDARARWTYEALGVRTEMVATARSPDVLGQLWGCHSRSGRQIT